MIFFTPRRGYELDRLLFRVKKDEEFRRRFFADFKSALEGFDLTEEEKKVLKARDYARLFELGVKDELIISLARFSKEKKTTRDLRAFRLL